MSTQHEKIDRLDCSAVYRIECGNCVQKHIDETGRKVGLLIKKHQRLCKNMDTERSEMAEHIARTGHEIDLKSTEILATYGENTRKRRIRETIDILTEKT
ncbi:unnamed protein product [Protopolystoma xenopodis]|uniref:Uncharacterized protein n=1 Tax=Protopolystoma xenopodis TaxID=117903 RepID=A0A3S5AMU6_9PLAT|nr:unnamed protein product [Protopolystoma xenopodis]